MKSESDNRLNEKKFCHRHLSFDENVPIEQSTQMKFAHLSQESTFPNPARTYHFIGRIRIKFHFARYLNVTLCVCILCACTVECGVDAIHIIYLFMRRLQKVVGRYLLSSIYEYIAHIIQCVNVNTNCVYLYLQVI